MLLDTATRISSSFGPRTSPIFGTPEMHTGIDIAAPMGTPIHAAADGVIAIDWLCGGYGNYVLIRHANETATGYAHASGFARAIYSGARVTAGQVIAYVGSTGLSTGPHLHFEVFVKGRPVSPACACTLPAAQPPARTGPEANQHNREKANPKSEEKTN
jgi:murein DD-endopeptidase MepM/ murein hydrolase activator NlpD